MLVLSRKAGQEIVINGNVTVRVIRIKGNVIQLGISAPKDVKIIRSELVSDPAEQIVEVQLEENDEKTAL